MINSIAKIIQVIVLTVHDFRDTEKQKEKNKNKKTIQNNNRDKDKPKRIFASVFF